MAADKLPFLPGRNTLPLLAQWAAMGALVGSALGVSSRRSLGTLSGLGALTVAITSWGSYHLRIGTIRKLDIPGAIAGLAEDVLVVGGGFCLLLATGRNRRDAGGYSGRSAFPKHEGQSEEANSLSEEGSDTSLPYRTVGPAQASVMEKGGDQENYNYQVPVFHGLGTEDEDLRWDYFVRHYSADERQRRDSKFVPKRDGVLYPRAGTLGGCTAHNAMITVYPQNSDWDEIARITKDPSWRSQDMRKYFERLERCQYIRRPRAYPRNPFLRSLVQRI